MSIIGTGFRLMMAPARFMGPWGLALLGVAGIATLISSACKGNLKKDLGNAIDKSPFRLFTDTFQGSNQNPEPSPNQ